jgi:cell division septation protein DedD
MIASMRLLVFLLVLANLLFFVWTQGHFGSSANPDALRLEQQLLADQVTIVARGEPPGGAAKAGKVLDKKAPDGCLLWNELPIAEADRLERLLAEKFTAFKARRSVTTGSSTYWAFIPPLANKQEAEKKAAELKKLGAPEFYVVQDAGPNRLAISLGIFSSEEAANERRETLRAKGIKTAQVGERSTRPALAALEVHGPGEQADALREAALALLPEVKPAACKVPAS